MKSYGNVKMTAIPSEIWHQFKQLQPEMVYLLKNAPKFGIASLEVHFMDGEIIRAVRHREESILLAEENQRT